MSGHSKAKKRSNQATAVNATPTDAAREPRVLLVDGQTPTRRTLEACANQGSPIMVHHVATLAEARAFLARRAAVDLVMVAEVLPDGPGLTLLEAIAQDKRVIQSMVLSSAPTAELAIRAMRQGACDLLASPLDMEDTNRRLREALSRQNRSTEPIRKARRLRKLCKKLNRARLDVSHQVDILCNDLVTAYQELAEQMQQAVTGNEFHALIKHELDLEQALRITLEFLVTKAGPTNAAIFLPATMDEYSLGGYVNYDCPSDAADLLLDHLADVVAPRMTDLDEVRHITTNTQMHRWLGDDAYYLADSELITFGCQHDGETLGVVALFRDQDQPFDRAVLDACGSIGPILGEALARIIRIHHRHQPELTFGDEGHGYSNPDALEGPDAPDSDELPF